MDKPEPLNILIIDDKLDSNLKVNLEQLGQVRVNLLPPQDVDADDLSTAQLVLVDYQLTEWKGRDDLSVIGLKPVDGLALATVLRRYLHDQEQSLPTAFALYTGQIDKLAAPFPPEYREHALAGINNLEWVFQKGKGDIEQQIVELASAVLVLPQHWSSETDDQPMRQLAELLGIQFDDEANEPLLEDIESCLPPIHELSQWSHGLAVLRWLLHRILPFPCFLWDTYRLAARFRVDHEALRHALSTDKPLREKLDKCAYQGVLPNFLGPRWWRSRVEAFLWEKTDGNSSDLEAVRRVINEGAQQELPASVPPDHPVVCLNTHYQPLDSFSTMEDAVRIRPDDWPAYADQAWTTIEMARNEPKLKAIVIREDRERLE